MSTVSLVLATPQKRALTETLFKSVTPGEGYLEALQADNVRVVRGPIDSINEKGLVTSDGTTHEVDVIIAATGYDTTYVPPYPLVGRNGIDLRDRWSKSGAEAYFTCAVPDMPNYFSMSPRVLPTRFTIHSLSSGHRPKFAHLKWVSNARDRNAD